MEHIIKDALSECERAPSQDKTKRCFGSAKYVIDFATSVLGNNVALRSTDHVKGSKQKIMIGSIGEINGGKVIKSVSCHRACTLIYLTTATPFQKFRVYEADILDHKTKEKINYGVSIYHVDTSAWSLTHGSGLIEVCHWIFENDFTWTTTYQSS